MLMFRLIFPVPPGCPEASRYHPRTWGLGASWRLAKFRGWRARGANLRIVGRSVASWCRASRSLERRGEQAARNWRGGESRQRALSAPELGALHRESRRDLLLAQTAHLTRRPPT